MPSFFVYCPDKPDHLAVRLSVRAEHLARAKIDKETGVSEFGRPFLQRADAKPHGLTLPPGVYPMGGSFMIWNLPSVDAVWDRIKEDPYFKAGVWEESTVIIEEFVPTA